MKQHQQIIPQIGFGDIGVFPSKNFREFCIGVTMFDKNSCGRSKKYEGQIFPHILVILHYNCSNMVHFTQYSKFFYCRSVEVHMENNNGLRECHCSKHPLFSFTYHPKNTPFVFMQYNLPILTSSVSFIHRFSHTKFKEALGSILIKSP